MVLVPLFISILQRNRSNSIYSREIYFKELANMIVGPGMSEICRAGKKVEIQIEVDLQFGV